MSEPERPEPPRPAPEAPPVPDNIEDFAERLAPYRAPDLDDRPRGVEGLH